ncbi:hypothetical protein [Haladaptatus sp. T7]|uniref:hypothetical protein n=1 Tax=Haladaptatus sp. T7 TaxID=2029368 RepID=UPI00222ED297|nr:hypothetical protein [Haladaptatus sp. T7]
MGRGATVRPTATRTVRQRRLSRDSSEDEPRRGRSRTRARSGHDARELYDTRHYAVTKTNADAGTKTKVNRADGGSNPRGTGSLSIR